MSCRQDSSTVVFSPSSARIAASTAKDWVSIDSWLSKLLPNEKLPDYERNSATLTVLLMLAGVSEAASDDRDLICTASKVSLTVVAGAELATNLTTGIPRCQNRPVLRSIILTKVINYLTREGKIAIEALADMSVQRRVYFSDPKDLGREFMDLQTLVYETEQVVSRINALNEHLLLELQMSTEQLAMFEGATYRLPTDLPKENLDRRRKTELKAKQISDTREHLKSSLSIPRLPCTIDFVMKEEKQLLGLLTRQKSLAMQIAAFRRLPSDPEKARDQLGALQERLRGLMARRDHVFEGLVEQASPLKLR